MIAIDATAGKIWFGRNGVWSTNSGGLGNPSSAANPDATGLTGTWYPGASFTSNALNSVSFPTTPKYTPPAGFNNL
jgi:hypothetical protein